LKLRERQDKKDKEMQEDGLQQREINLVAEEVIIHQVEVSLQVVQNLRALVRNRKTTANILYSA